MQRGGENAVVVIQKQVACHQRHPAVNERGHIAHAQDFRALDVKILREQHNGDAHHVDRDDEPDAQLQRVEHIGAHVAGEEEADDGEGIGLARRVLGAENLRQRVQIGEDHKTKEQIDKHAHPKKAEDVLGLEPAGFCLHGLPSPFG